MTGLSGRAAQRRVLLAVPWFLGFVLIAILAERRFSVSIPMWIVLPAALALSLPCAAAWHLGTDDLSPRHRLGFSTGAYLASVLAFGVGVGARNGLTTDIRGGSADLAHHSAIVNVLAHSGASDFQARLPTLRYYPIGAHLPAALIERITGWNALSITYVFSLLAVVGLFAAIAFVVFQLMPRNPWAAAATLVWVGSAWKPIFLESVMSNFFYSQQVGLAFAVLSVGYAISALRGSPRATAWMAFAGTAVAGCYPTYIAIVAPIFVLVIVDRWNRQRARLSIAQAASMVVGPFVAAVLSIYFGPGADTVKNEGAITTISASYYFGGSVLLLLALVGTVAAFGQRPPGDSHSIWAYLKPRPWSVVQIWFVVSLGFLLLNWLVFHLDIYGSRYNSVKCIYPVAACLAVFVAVFIGDLVPETLLDGLARCVRPFAVCAAVVIVSIWSNRFSPVPVTISADQIRAIEFARDSGVAFAPIKPDALDYIMTVALSPLDPGNPGAVAILTDNVAEFQTDDLYVDKGPPQPTVAAVDGSPLTPVCRFGSATVYARSDSPAVQLVDHCPTRDRP